MTTGKSREHPSGIRSRAPVIAIMAGAIVLQGFLIRFDAFDRLHALSKQYAGWQLDELFTLFIVATFTLGALLFWRSRRLAEEVARRIAAEERIGLVARHDPLTGLPNRVVFRRQLERRVAELGAGGKLALFAIDLYRFQTVNDMYGIPTGDHVLQVIAERLRSVVRGDDLIARLGGDEFAVVVGRNDDDEVTIRMVNRLIAILERPFQVDDYQIEIGPSVGIALYPEDSRTAEDFLQRADTAMYRAKLAGRGAHAFFHVGIDVAIRNRAALEMELRRAVGTDEIVPYYQPLVQLDDGRVTGFEVLARWNHPLRGIIMPSVFIPIAEDSGLIGDLLVGILRQALVDARQWDQGLVLSINIAPIQFQDPRLGERILAIFAEAGFPPSRLEVEVTETALVANLAAAKTTLDVLKREGVKIALDDFGTGYSSLHHLNELPFDLIKIDGSFVTTGRDNPESAKIVSAIIGLSTSLGLPVTAEGIERPADVAWLRQLGCNLGQGFLYSRPVPADAVPPLFAAARNLRLSESA